MASAYFLEFSNVSIVKKWREKCEIGRKNIFLLCIKISFDAVKLKEFIDRKLLRSCIKLMAEIYYRTLWAIIIC